MAAKRITVRTASPKHEPLMRRWRSNSRREHGMEPVAGEAVDARNSFLAFEAGKPVGMMNLTTMPLSVGYEKNGPMFAEGRWLDLNYVPPEHRGRGIRSRLMDHLERVARRKGISSVITYSLKPEGTNSLRRRGYEELGPIRGYYDAKGHFVPLASEKPMVLFRKRFV